MNYSKQLFFSWNCLGGGDSSLWLSIIGGISQTLLNTNWNFWKGLISGRAKNGSNEEGECRGILPNSFVDKFKYNSI